MDYKKSIYLKAYAHLNLGDDLFMDIIFKRYPDVLFYIECDKDKYNSFFKQYNNVKCIFYSTNYTIKAINYAKKIFLPTLRKKANENHYRSILKNVDAVVVIGGSMFMQSSTNVENDFDISFYRMIKKLFDNKHMFFLGGNFGPYKTPDYKRAYDEIFSRAYDVCFREQYSYELFRHIDKVRVEPDIVFSYKINYEVSTISRSVGFSIVPAAKAKADIDEQMYIKKYTEIINAFAEKNYTIKLFSFCEREGDEQIINKIYAALNKKQDVHKVFYKGDVQVFLKEYTAVESVFCGRFHALILSMVYGQKILPIAYSKKMVNILDDISYAGVIIDLEEFIGYDLSNITEVSNTDYDVSISKQKGILHFKKLDEFIISR